MKQKVPCPVCGREVTNVTSHIKKMAMGEVYVMVKEEHHDFHDDLRECPHEQYIVDNSQPNFKYTEPA